MPWYRRAADLALGLTLVFLVQKAGRAAGVDPAGALLAAGRFLADPVPAVQAAGEVMRRQMDFVVEETPEQAPGAAGQNPVQTWQDSGLWANPTPVPAVEESPEPVLTPPPGAGQVQAVQYPQGSGQGYITLPAGSIKNATALEDSQVARMASAGLPFDIELNSSQPQVLIMHTHATETYLEEGVSWYTQQDTGRTTDPALNMAAVGAELARVLNQAGINTLQDTTLHDYPSYVGSYERSNQTVRQYLEKHPSIKVVLDVHRDAIERDGAWVAPLSVIQGAAAAQIMLICGCDNGGNLPNYSKNLAFAAAWQSTMEGMHPGLTRPVLFDYRYYNQDLTTGSLLVEVGGHGNTLPQALESARLAGQSLVRLFGAG